MNYEEFNEWVDALVEEGYDLSEYTWEEIYEAITAVAAPGDNHKPGRNIKKSIRKIQYNSPYKHRPKKELQEEVEMTPYQYWKSMIQIDEPEEDTQDTEADGELTNEETSRPQTSYEYWKEYIEG